MEVIINVQFRVATIDDVEKIIDLCNKCFSENTDIDYAKEVFNETVNSLNDIYIIGEVDGDIVSHTKITLIKTMYDTMGTYSILNHVCVKPGYRRYGIATKMFDYVADICKKNNCIKMMLFSNNSRTAAHSCYNRYGFELVDAGFFSKDLNKICI